MKTFRQIMMATAITFVLSGCASLISQGSRANVLSSIQKGMSKQEITSLLGSPDFRRFDNAMEEWEYTKRLYNEKITGTTTQIVISFEDDKVVAMDSFEKDPYPMPPTPNGMLLNPSVDFNFKGMHPGEFQRLYEKIKSRPFKDDRLEMMLVVSRNNRLNCRQCAKLMSLCPFDDDKIKVLKMFAPGIKDIENYDEILDVIDSLFKKDDAKKILGIR
ncbi:Beta-barrel assembly machine subunit BamE [Bacteroides zoogleoformans]|uniref:Beta-barrel assembly machine subunit BamE n=1 Tax=Bacteroides zoogleoformans TaxID=28119 RepID=A0ABM6T5G1_9BACE|nr:DUF4476 domain-containing protein [Bacteroides zoogleoformans]AVM51845.1 hypothetical protein C4H11_01710 [Bacteroides zoogleoformans]TWJ16931.1 Beta-barrel assembly machine subunit BamE [Bacteroides zoogleoformans]